MQRLLIFMILVVGLAILQHVMTFAAGAGPERNQALNVGVHASQMESP